VEIRHYCLSLVNVQRNQPPKEKKVGGKKYTPANEGPYDNWATSRSTLACKQTHVLSFFVRKIDSLIPFGFLGPSFLMGFLLYSCET